MKFLTFLFCLTAFGAMAQRDFYELKKYRIESQAQERQLDTYLRNAYLPAAHRAGIPAVGVFKPIAADTAHAGKYIYVFTPFKSLEAIAGFPEVLAADKAYQKDGKAYIDADHTQPPYVRYETTLLRAFPLQPQYQQPRLSAKPSGRIYELRSYEGATEKRYLNKVAMFNEGGEIALFNRLGFQAMFYGEVLAGATQPNLMYMTVFENKAERDQYWETFRTDAGWNQLKADPGYQNNVSKNVTLLLYPTDYSDL